ncbi:DUF1672 family protein [Cytobacillus kochii]|uniref:DUF1672 domain-containing protein n=2 Tax=Cytobacillus kochii TaxID=859143 RepID=A0A248TP78_9BACI|nr:DUF1672 family protein [Cytobacillus kochii]ASV70007.1 hypothetical protein CKF48_11135 [Cytobacillus kochii]MDQ0187832.1 hypothetical protein [Cytobacillus kochii]
MNTTKFLFFSVGVTLMLGSCSGGKLGEIEPTPPEDGLVSVSDYNGEGYALPHGKETEQIAESHRELIEEATIAFFQENYQTEVVVHNVVGAQGSATIFVESVGEPHFYTYAVVPVDESEKKVIANQIWADEYQVQNAIQGGLYHMIFNQAFGQLDEYFTSITKEEEITGKTKEALQNIGGHGFMTPYYFISTDPNDAAIKPVYNLYLQNPDSNIETLKDAYEESLFDKENFQINIQLFMRKKEAEPIEEIFTKVTTNLEEMNNIPKGTYSFYLNDHFIHAESGEGTKENSLKRAFPDYIVKE